MVNVPGLTADVKTKTTAGLTGDMSVSGLLLPQTTLPEAMRLCNNKGL